MQQFLLIPAGVAGYLIGSIPWGVIFSRLFGWPDPREHGSGHTGGLNTARNAGFASGAAVLFFDLLKGVAAVAVARLISPHPYSIVVGGVLAVVGHCWPVWLRFSGGMGLSTGMGAVGIVYVPGVLIAIALLGGLRFTVIRHTPRATVIASLLLAIVMQLLPLANPDAWLGTGVALIIAVRHLSDWNRVYEDESGI